MTLAPRSGEMIIVVGVALGRDLGSSFSAGFLDSGLSYCSVAGMKH